MLDFFKWIFSDERKQTEGDSISGAELTGETEDEQQTKDKKDEPEFIIPTLSMHPDLEDKFSVMQSVIKHELSALPPVKMGDITINGIYAYKDEEELEVAFYIRSGLPRPVKFDEVPLIIVNSKKEVLARQVFNLQEVGQIPPHSARPWQIRFAKENVFADDVPIDDWKIAFDMKPQKDIKFTYDYLSENFTESERSFLEQFLNNLPPINPGELSFSPLQARLTEERNLVTTLVMRNSGAKSVQLSGIQLIIKDAKENEVAEGTFEINGLSVNPYKAVLWSVNFPSEAVKKEEIDLTTWSVIVKGCKLN